MEYPSLIARWGRCVGLVAALLVAGAPAAGAAKSEVGLVVVVQGKPIATDSSGHWRPAEVLQSIHDGETVVFDTGDVLVVCSQRRGEAFRIDGPGTVSIGQTAVAVLAGSPRVTTAGACDDDVAADSNGGVILRGMAPHGTPPPSPGQP